MESKQASGVTNVGDLMKEQERIELKLRQDGVDGVQVDDDKRVITLDGWYEIPAERCQTKEQLLHWVTHITAKKWITRYRRRYWPAKETMDKVIADGLVEAGLKQDRRALQLPVEDLSWELIDKQDNQALVLSFVLSAGSFATSVLREVVQYQDVTRKPS